MYIVMNRFRVRRGREEDFEEVWASRETHLEEVPGFRTFHLLRGATGENETLFSSHSIWASRRAFENWTRSEAFRLAHRNAAEHRDLYLAPPQLECFEVVQTVEARAGD